MSEMNTRWTYFSEEKYSGIVLSLRPGEGYNYRAPDGKRYEVTFIARRGGKIRIGIRPVDENGNIIPKQE